MPSKNSIRLAAGGAGKTTAMVREAGAASQNAIAILTYTNNNYDEIVRIFYREFGSIPSHVSVYTWYTFLLRECIRPYQPCFYDASRIESIFFLTGRSLNWASKANVERYYICHGRYIYSDKAAEFALECAQRSDGRWIRRLNDMFDHIYVDEVQDLAGYDLDLIDRLMRSNILVTLIGDVRQATYSTNQSPRNSQYRGPAIRNLFLQWKQAGQCHVDECAESHRCNQTVCDLADSLYPDMPRTTSKNLTVTGHDGLFMVPRLLVSDYVRLYTPAVLRYDLKTKCGEYVPMNFGDSKGKTFDRVLIFPNGPIKSYFSSGDIRKITSPAKYYVAFTRARFSLAFAYEGACKVPYVSQYSWPAEKPRPEAAS
ncbi:MAG: helicase superfamily [Betaproteobacteria bacterium]|jgi:DNA helicase-2/ATP-dependent DNA helicase PcrA|nr:helicase superfamily [Betaproteobacteria bacterium]